MEYKYKIIEVANGFILDNDIESLTFFPTLDLLLAHVLRQYVYSWKNTFTKEISGELKLKVEWKK